VIQQRVPGSADAHRIERSVEVDEERSTSSARGRADTGPAKPDPTGSTSVRELDADEYAAGVTAATAIAARTTMRTFTFAQSDRRVESASAVPLDVRTPFGAAVSSCSS